MIKEDVCGRPFCIEYDCHHNGMHEGKGPNGEGWCYRHDTAHVPFDKITDLKEEMD